MPSKASNKFTMSPSVDREAFDSDVDDEGRPDNGQQAYSTENPRKAELNCIFSLLSPWARFIGQFRANAS